MSKITFEKLLEAGAHFGHQKRKWNPAMAPYIFEEKKGIHIIDLNKTIAHLDQACAAMKQIAKSGKKILFVATKKKAKEIVAQKVAEINMPFVTWETLNKRERLFKQRQRDKLEKNFGSIVDMTRQPAAIFIVDILKEHIALAEAKRLNIPTFAMVDTNSNPRLVDFPIPANDDATKSISIIMEAICGSIREGLEDRKNSKDKADADDETAATKEATAEKAVEVTVEVVAETPAAEETEKKD